MDRLFIIIIFLLSGTIAGNSATIGGRAVDSNTGELLVGCTIFIKEINKGTITGLDGTYQFKNVPSGNYIISANLISYNTITQTLSVKTDGDNQKIDFLLEPVSISLNEVTVISKRDKSSDLSARNSERMANQVINVVSAKTIELSPDLNVATVIQRMSGVTLDKNSSGSGQYALLRGMDKRYNYTLVNGIKIPSTHNKHRYVSLDLFPSDMVDRIEVTKAITPDMEGDAIAGAVNLIMKNAPDEFFVQVNASTGFSQFFAKNDYLTFDHTVLNSKSPYEQNKKGYNAVPSDFASKNLLINNDQVPVNYFGNVIVSNRFLKKELGWILSGSYQNSYNGLNSLYFDDDLSRDGKNLPILTSMEERIYSEKKMNYGIHNKIDYRLNQNHQILLYTAYLNMDNTQVREVQDTDLAVSYDPGTGNVNRKHSTRFRYNNQNLLNATLQGIHQFGNNLHIRWSGVYSRANNRTPEQATVIYANGLSNFVPVKQYVNFDGSDRIWRHNSDEDKAAYLDLNYNTRFWDYSTELSIGGMYRKKDRSSFYNKYTLQAIVNNTDGTTSFYSEKGVDWDTYDEILWRVYNPRGTVAVGENYDAYENVAAAYGMFKIDIKRLQVTGGARLENTDQGYYMEYPAGEPQPEGNQKYTDILPSLHLKYAPTAKQNIRLSYYKAINKPGFQEIVPYIDASEEPSTAGNKNLKHAMADNLDLRFEYFPSPTDQLMAGLFYKNIKNAIEFAFDKFMNVSQQIVYTPINSDKAVNYGIEIDVIKYYREWGIKGNYTFTKSDISSKKLSRVKDENGNDSTAYVYQKRPLFGQSMHTGNISLLYKGLRNGINAQLAFSYTGDRIYTVSRYIDNDLWQKGFWQLDASAEKKFKNGLGIFVKVNNLMNSHVKVYIQKTNPLNNDVPYHTENDKNTLVRDEYSMQSYLIGIRYKF
jgi:TonB-dependent receptor